MPSRKCNAFLPFSNSFCDFSNPLLGEWTLMPLRWTIQSISASRPFSVSISLPSLTHRHADADAATLTQCCRGTRPLLIPPENAAQIPPQPRRTRVTTALASSGRRRRGQRSASAWSPSPANSNPAPQGRALSAYMPVLVSPSASGSKS